MSDNNIDVTIGGNATGAVAAMTDAASAVKGGVEQMSSGIEQLGAVFERFKGMFVLFSAVLAGGEAFKASIQAANNWNSQVGAMAKQMGITTQQASVMSVALHGIGVSSDTYRQAAMMMTRQISSNASAFKVLGVAVKDAHTGALRPISDVMSDVNTKLNGLTNTAERNTAGMKVYGRGWAEVQGILKLNAGAMKEAQETAERLHLIVGPEGVAQTKAYAKEQRELGLVAESLEIQVGNTLLPVMVKLGAWLGDIGPSVASRFSQTMALLGTAVEDLWDIFRSFNDLLSEVCTDILGDVTEVFGSKLPENFDIAGYAIKVCQSLFTAFRFAVLEVFQAVAGYLEVAASDFKTFGQVANDVLHLDFAAAKADMAAGFEQIESIAKQHAAKMVQIKTDSDAKLKEVWGAPKKKEAESTGDKSSQDGGQHLDFDKQKKGKSGGSDQMAVWKAELEQKKEDSNDFFKDDLNMEVEFWQSKLALVKGNSKQEVAERRQIQNELYQLDKQQVEQGRQLEDEEISYEEKAGKQKVETEKAAIQAKKDMGEIGAVQEIQQLQKVKDEEYLIERQALEAKKDLYEQDRVAKQKVLDQIALLEKQHSMDATQSATAMAQAQKTQTEAMLAPISQAMDKTVTGMIMGTQTLRQAEANIVQNILGEFISMLTRKGVMWAATEVGMTAASKTGSSVRDSLSTTSSSTAISAKSTEAMGAVSGNAAEAASGAAASVSAIPVAGWAMAPGVFASVMAMVLGAKSMIPSAAGGFDIPAGVNPLTQLHEKEMVLPKEHAEAIRNMTGGSSGGGSQHLHIHATDAASVERLFKNNGAALTKAAKEQLRRFAR